MINDNHFWLACGKFAFPSQVTERGSSSLPAPSRCQTGTTCGRWGGPGEGQRGAVRPGPAGIPVGGEAGDAVRPDGQLHEHRHHGVAEGRGRVLNTQPLSLLGAPLPRHVSLRWAGPVCEPWGEVGGQRVPQTTFGARISLFGAVNTRRTLQATS